MSFESPHLVIFRVETLGQVVEDERRVMGVSTEDVNHLCGQITLYRTSGPSSTKPIVFSRSTGFYSSVKEVPKYFYP